MRVPLRVAGWVPDLGPLRDRRFRLFFTGQAVSALGDALIPVATAFAVLRIARGGFALGAVLATLWVCRALSSPVGGVVADRYDRVRVMLASECARAAAEGFLAVVLLLGHGHLWEFLASVAVYGLASGLFGPASMGFLQKAVAEEHRQVGNAAVAVSQSAIAVVGPALSGVVAALGAYFVVYGADALTFVFSALCLIRLARLVGVGPAGNGDVGEPPAVVQGTPVRRLRDELGQGLQAVRGHSWLWFVFNASAFTNLCIAVYFVLGPIVAKSTLGGVAAWGGIGASAASGALVGSVLALRVRLRSRQIGAYLAMGACVPLPFAALASGKLVLVVVASLLSAASVSFGVVMLDTAVQGSIEPDVIARVDSLDSLTSFLPMPVGLLSAVAVASALGMRSTLVGLACLAAVTNFLPLLSAGVRNLGRSRPER